MSDQQILLIVTVAATAWAYYTYRVTLGR